MYIVYLFIYSAHYDDENSCEAAKLETPLFEPLQAREGKRQE
jgi:hypothetical protein